VGKEVWRVILGRDEIIVPGRKKKIGCLLLFKAGESLRKKKEYGKGKKSMKISEGVGRSDQI